MTEAPELLAVVLRPAMMVVVGAIVYRAGKLVAPRHLAARIAFGATCLLFALDLTMIAYPDLRSASAVSTVIGVAVLAVIFRKRAVHG